MHAQNIALGLSLEQRERKFRALLDKSNLLIFVLDRQYQIRYSCEYTPQILHIECSEILGKGFYEIFKEEVVGSFEKVVETIWEEPDASREIRNLSILTKEGKRLYFDGTITNLRNDPEVNGLVLYIFDITARKETQDKLMEAHFELDNFIYRASHDMRSPLLSAIGLANIAQKEYPNDTMKYIQMMAGRMLKLDRFILDLTSYSFNERMEVQKKPTLLLPICHEIVEELDYLPNYKKINILFDVVDKEINCDCNRIRIILQNLISNAIRFADQAKAHSVVRITINTDSGRLTLEINDNGLGIDPAHVGKIFDMFFRGSSTSEGSGLGLYIVKKVVHKLNGHISVDSNLQIGTRFIVSMPC